MDNNKQNNQDKQKQQFYKYKPLLPRNLPHLSTNTFQLVMVSGKDYVNRSKKAIDLFRSEVIDAT